MKKSSILIGLAMLTAYTIGACSGPVQPTETAKPQTLAEALAEHPLGDELGNTHTYPLSVESDSIRSYEASSTADHDGLYIEIQPISHDYINSSDISLLIQGTLRRDDRTSKYSDQVHTDTNAHGNGANHVFSKCVSIYDGALDSLRKISMKFLPGGWGSAEYHFHLDDKIVEGTYSEDTATCK